MNYSIYIQQQKFRKMFRTIQSEKERKNYHGEGMSKQFLVDFQNKILYMPAYMRAQVKKIDKVDMKNNKFDILMKLTIIIDYTDLSRQRKKTSEVQKKQQEKLSEISDDGKDQEQANKELEELQKFMEMANNQNNQGEQEYEDQYGYDTDEDYDEQEQEPLNYEQKQKDLKPKQQMIQKKQKNVNESRLSDNIKAKANKQKDLESQVTKYYKNEKGVIVSKDFKLRLLIIQTLKEEGFTILKDQEEIIRFNPKDPETLLIDDVENFQLIYEVTKIMQMSLESNVYWSPFQLLFLYTSLQFVQFKPQPESKWTVRFNLMECEINQEMIQSSGNIFLQNYQIADRLLFITADNHSIGQQNVRNDYNYYLHRGQEGIQRKQVMSYVSLKASNQKLTKEFKVTSFLMSSMKFITSLGKLAQKIKDPSIGQQFQKIEKQLTKKFQEAENGRPIKQLQILAQRIKTLQKLLKKKIDPGNKEIQQISKFAQKINSFLPKNTKQQEKKKKKKKTVMTDNYGFGNIVVGAYKKPVDSFSVIFMPLWGIATANIGIFLTNNDINLRVAAVAGIFLAYVAHMNIYRDSLPDNSSLLFIEYIIYFLILSCLLVLAQSVYIHTFYTQQPGKPETHFQFKYYDPFFIVAIGILGVSVVSIAILFIIHYLKWQGMYKKTATIAIIWKNLWTLEFWKKIFTNPSVFCDILRNRSIDSIMKLIKQIDTKNAIKSALQNVQNDQEFSQFDLFIWNNKKCDEFFEKKKFCGQVETLIPIQEKKKYAYDSKSTINHFKKFHDQLQYDYHNGIDLLEYEKEKQNKRQFIAWKKQLQRLIVKDQYNKIKKNQNIKKGVQIPIDYKELVIDYLLLPKRYQGIIIYEKKQAANQVNIADQNQQLNLNIVFDYNPYIFHGFVYKEDQGNLIQQDLWQLLYILVKQANAFHQNKLGKLGNIKPQNIFIVNQAFKMRCRYSWPGAQIYKTNKNNPQYKAPEQFTNPIQFSVSSTYAQYASYAQAFSIGLTMLDILLLRDYSRRFYNEKGEFNSKLFIEKQAKTIKRIGIKLKESEKLKQILVGMCQVQPQDRFSCYQIYVALKKYENYLLNDHPFDYSQIELENKQNIDLRNNKNEISIEMFNNSASKYIMRQEEPRSIK